MSCFCKQQLNVILDALKGLPMSQMAALGSPGGTLSLSASMAANVSAAISANAAASATASANASISASAVARLEAAAQLHAALGGGVMGSASVGRMSVLIQSLNAVVAPMLQEISAVLAPVFDALMKLQQLAGSLANIQSMTGLNLLMPNVSFVPPPLPSFAAMAAAAASMSATANASASASANASLAASASASAQASANAVMALRLQGAAMQMGFPLPGGIQGLNTAVGMLPALPAVSPVGAAMSVVQQMVASLMSVQGGLGVNPFAPNAMAMLQPILATISQNLSASLAGNATATANIAGTASANAIATAQALASINSNAVLDAAAQIPFPSIPDLQTAAASIGLGQNLGMLTGTNPLRTSPCVGCVVPGWK